MINRNPLSRRDFLRLLGVGTAAIMTAPSISLASTRKPERVLSFYNLHTGEKVKASYWVNGRYIPSELARINHILRDYREDTQIRMDVHLLDALFQLQQKLHVPKREIHVVSAYRSPKTNAMLREASAGVAKKSMHLEGKAIDLRIPGVDLRHVYNGAKSMQAGGVGYYAKSDFVHIDTGKVRYW